ncbi:MAG: response regulator receiver modulated diguanylate cyclase/phosphodiesterase with sensor(s) [Burkholderiaceae bacterium]|nr:response regulator receiver modulated diguanylate cyclase/phosphodiesterase with sensor(s) [Burkholderiaceae bacterium]
MNAQTANAGIFHSVAFVHLLLDRQWRIRSINRAGMAALGYAQPDELVGMPLESLVPAGQWDGLSLAAARVALEQGGAPPSFSFELLCRDGQSIPILWNLDQPANVVGGEPGILLLGFDATAIRHSQEAIALFQSVAENYSGSIVITDGQSHILYANPAAQRIMGYPIGELFGRPMKDFRSGKTPAEVYHQLKDALARRELWKGEFINRRKDGELYVESKTIAAIQDENGEVQYYFAIGENITQRQEYEKQIERLMMFDQLTGLPNLGAFQREIAAAQESARTGGQQVALLHVDFDDFKKINRAIGSDAAEQVLTETAVRIKEILRKHDIAARVAGDEFAILIGPGESEVQADSMEIARRVLVAIRRPFLYAGQTITLTASIGIARYPDAEGNDDLLGNAMNATLRAKHTGGNDICLFEAAMANDENWRRELLQAIERNELVLYYQPQINLYSGAIVGVEALIRWLHPVRGLVPPSEFIPLAEESNHIIEIGEWVLVEACRQMRAWQDAGLPPIKVAVNLAARHFRQPTLPGSIALALTSQRIDPSLFEIEITESAMMLDMVAAVRNMGQLKELGVHIALDDFGTGYSSMAYLSRFPIDIVKIDQSFVRDITTNPANAAIAKATIAMSHKLGKKVLAEGVETLEQMTYLRRSECDEMQGYYFSRPVPAGEIARMLRQDRRVAAQSPKEEAAARDTILLLDDEASILSALKRTLRREGYNILTAQSASEGFALMAKEPVKLIVCDQHMSEMTGTQFLSQARIMYPETVRIVLSGFSEIATVTDAINKGAAYRFLTKPWNDEQLKEEIRGALRHWRELYARERGSGRQSALFGGGI